MKFLNIPWNRYDKFNRCFSAIMDSTVGEGTKNNGNTTHKREQKIQIKRLEIHGLWKWSPPEGV